MNFKQPVGILQDNKQNGETKTKSAYLPIVFMIFNIYFSEMNACNLSGEIGSVFKFRLVFKVLDTLLVTILCGFIIYTFK